MNVEQRGGWSTTSIMILVLLSVLLFFGMMFIAALLLGIPGGLFGFIGNLFSVSSPRMFWYISRSAGIMAYLLLWFSTVWGFLLASKLISQSLNQGYAFDFHEFISLLSLGFITVHVIPLYWDNFRPFSIAQMLVPFLGEYKTLWVGLGIITMYITVLVTLSFYLRTQIGKTAFGWIHASSVLGYVLVLLHGAFTGTDSSLPVMQQFYFWAGIIAFFAGSYWGVQKWLEKREQQKKAPPQPAKPLPRQNWKPQPRR